MTTYTTRTIPKFKEGEHVKIISTINTKKLIGLDLEGIMESFIGSIKRIISIDEYYGEIRYKIDKYYWSEKDLGLAEIKETEPVIVKFNPNELIGVTL